MGGGLQGSSCATGDGGGGGGAWCPVGLSLGDVEGVLATLLAAAEDYSVDKRGDVGSWCRVDALAGMERLLRLAARASRGLPLANRGESASWGRGRGVCASLCIWALMVVSTYVLWIWLSGLCRGEWCMKHEQVQVLVRFLAARGESQFGNCVC